EPALKRFDESPPEPPARPQNLQAGAAGIDNFAQYGAEKPRRGRFRRTVEHGEGQRTPQPLHRRAFRREARDRRLGSRRKEAPGAPVVGETQIWAASPGVKEPPGPSSGVRRDPPALSGREIGEGDARAPRRPPA